MSRASSQLEEPTVETKGQKSQTMCIFRLLFCLWRVTLESVVGWHQIWRLLLVERSFSMISFSNPSPWADPPSSSPFLQSLGDFVPDPASPCRMNLAIPALEASISSVSVPLPLDLLLIFSGASVLPSGVSHPGGRDHLLGQLLA